MCVLKQAIAISLSISKREISLVAVGFSNVNYYVFSQIRITYTYATKGSVRERGVFVQQQVFVRELQENAALQFATHLSRCYRKIIQFWISMACWRFRIQPCSVQHLHVFYFLLIVELWGFRVKVNQDSLRCQFVEIVACYFPTAFGVIAWCKSPDA